MKTLRYLSVATSLCLLSLESQSFAEDATFTQYGLRPLAMGNAFVAVADDYNALFYNPAGLGRLKTWDGEILNPYIEMSAATRDFYSDISDLASGSAGDTQSILDLFEEQSGKVHHIAFGLVPHLIIPTSFGGVGFGLALDVGATMVFHRYPTVDVDIGPRLIVPLSVAFNLIDKKLSVGAGLKYRLKGGIDHEFGIQDFAAFSKKGEDDEDAPELKDYVVGGSAVGADVGILFTPIEPMQPTIGLSVIDLTGINYQKANVVSALGDSTTAPRDRPASVNMGYSMKPLQGERYYLLTAVDTHSINQPFSFSKKLNFGTELGLSQILKLQLGLHQGYLTGGFQIDVGIINFRFVSYAEEMGEVAGSIPDRRYALQLKLII